MAAFTPFSPFFRDWWKPVTSRPPPFSPFPFSPFFRHLWMLLSSSPFFLASMDKFDDHVKGRKGNISTSAMARRRRLEVVFPLQETSDELMIMNFARLICSVVSYLQRRAFHGEMSLQGYDGPYRRGCWRGCGGWDGRRCWGWGGRSWGCWGARGGEEGKLCTACVAWCWGCCRGGSGRENGWEVWREGRLGHAQSYQRKFTVNVGNQKRSIC